MILGALFHYVYEKGDAAKTNAIDHIRPLEAV